MDQDLNKALMKLIVTKGMLNGLTDVEFTSGKKDIIESLCITLARVIVAALQAERKINHDEIAAQCKQAYNLLLKYAFEANREIK
jgi:hypothetical protein